MNDFKIALGLDYGRRKIGAAVGEQKIGSARPLPIIQMKNGQPSWEDLDKIMEKWSPEAIVLGVSTHLDGTTHNLTEEIEILGRNLKKRYDTPVFFIDEHLSSQAAVERKKNGIKSPLDSVAAGLILETWFEEQKKLADIVQ